MFKKAVTWLMIVCTVMSVLPVFGLAAAAEEKTAPSSARYSSKTSFSAAPAESDLEDLRTDNPVDFLLDLLKAIVTNLRSLPVSELLKLPANAMDDLTTFIFSILKFFGLNIDSLYEKLSSLLVSI